MTSYIAVNDNKGSGILAQLERYDQRVDGLTSTELGYSGTNDNIELLSGKCEYEIT